MHSLIVKLAPMGGLISRSSHCEKVGKCSFNVEDSGRNHWWFNSGVGETLGIADRKPPRIVWELKQAGNHGQWLTANEIEETTSASA